MPDDNTIEFLPFHAINEFMRPDFRLTVVRSVLNSYKGLPANNRQVIDRLTNRFVKVPGFRNSEKAPSAIKLLPMAKAFENNPEIVAAILSAWAEIHTELRQQVLHVLRERGWYFFSSEFQGLTHLHSLKAEKDWGILPADADRTRLPGFLIYWPKSETFEEIYQTYTRLYPDAQGSMDEVSLMAVWLSLRLPYQMVDRELPSVQATNNTSESKTETVL